MQPDDTAAASASADDSTLPFGTLVYVGVGASMLACYGRTLFAQMGGTDTDAINPHAQAVFMWGLVLVAIAGLYRDRHRHENNLPLVLGGIGLAVIMGALYVHYTPVLEMSAYIVLVAAALLNQNAMLKDMHGQIEAQAGTLADFNAELERRVAEQVGEIGRLERLRRFLAPEVANAITADDERSVLKSHRADITVLFCDLRGFTSFSESSEPEEVMQVLQDYHAELGRLVDEAGGTIDHRAGDGLMVFFNDPIPCERPTRQAVRLAFGMREAFNTLNARWARQGYGLGFGVGIASGFATIGVVGYEGRFDYTANGNAVNLASRLCDAAADGQVLLSRRAWLDVESEVSVVHEASLELKGVTGAVDVLGVEPAAPARPSETD